MAAQTFMNVVIWQKSISKGGTYFMNDYNIRSKMPRMHESAFCSISKKMI